MPLWGKLNQQNNAPKSTTFVVDRVAGKRLTGTGNVVTSSAARPNDLSTFSNTTVGAFEALEAVGTFGVNTAVVQSRYTATGSKGISPGWINATIGTGPVTSLTVVTPSGLSYSNTDKFVLSGGTSNATVAITTNTTGGIVATSVVNGGAGFANVSVVTLAIANSTGGASAGSGGDTASNYKLALGGRAGRVLYETLVFIKNGGKGVTGGTQNLP